MSLPKTLTGPIENEVRERYSGSLRSPLSLTRTMAYLRGKVSDCQGVVELLKLFRLVWQVKCFE